MKWCYSLKAIPIIISNGSSLLILKKERLLGVQEIKRMIYFGQQLHTLVQHKKIYS